METIVDLFKKYSKVIFSVAVIVALVIACVSSVVRDRRRVTKDMGRMVSLNALYDEPAMKPLYARASYDSLDVSNVYAGEIGSGKEVGAFNGKNLTDQQKKDKAALEELLKSSQQKTGKSKGDLARDRNQKYAINKIKEVNQNASVNVTAGAGGGVYASNSQGTYLGKFLITGYCPCVICCDKTDGITASGRPATANHTIAADSRYAFGTQMIINGMVYTVDDRGGAITGNHIDMYFNTHAEALQWGKRTMDVYLYTGPATPSNTAQQTTTTTTNSSGSVSMIGDSLMVGATSNIKAIIPSANIDAKVGRQQSAGYDIVSGMKSSGTLGDKVVIELGTNGPFSESDGQKLIDNIGSDKKIYWVNTYGPSLSWYAESNAVIAKLCNSNSNVTLIDWCSVGSSNQSLFGGDGIHLTSEGYQKFAQLICDAVK